MQANVDRKAVLKWTVPSSLPYDAHKFRVLIDPTWGEGGWRGRGGGLHSGEGMRRGRVAGRCGGGGGGDVKSDLPTRSQAVVWVIAVGRQCRYVLH